MDDETQPAEPAPRPPRALVVGAALVLTAGLGLGAYYLAKSLPCGCDDKVSPADVARASAEMAGGETE